MKQKIVIGWFPMLMLVSFFVVAFGGWVANIVKLFGTSFDPLTAMAVMRVVGIFMAPIGSVLGFL